MVHCSTVQSCNVQQADHADVLMSIIASQGLLMPLLLCLLLVLCIAHDHAVTLCVNSCRAHKDSCTTVTPAQPCSCQHMACVGMGDAAAEQRQGPCCAHTILCTLREHTCTSMHAPYQAASKTRQSSLLEHKCQWSWPEPRQELASKAAAAAHAKNAAICQAACKTREPCCSRADTSS